MILSTLGVCPSCFAFGISQKWPLSFKLEPILMNLNILISQAMCNSIAYPNFPYPKGNLVQGIDDGDTSPQYSA